MATADPTVPATDTVVTGTAVTFTTAQVPPTERIERWEANNADALIGLECRTLDDDSFEATETTLQLGDLQLAHVRGTAHVVERPSSLVRRRPTEAVAVYVSLRGESFFYDGDSTHLLRPGQLLICDADRPFLRGFAQGLEESVLTVPRALLAAHDLPLGPLSVTVADLANNPYARSLAQSLDALGDAAPPDPQQLVDLVGALTTTPGSAGPHGHLAAARAVVDRRFGDPRLSATEVASVIGVSPRHLSRVLAAADTSFPRLLLERRLRGARSLLRNPHAHAAVAEIATRCGFSSPSHFSATYTALFGETPSQTRRAVRRGE